MVKHLVASLRARARLVVVVVAEAAVGAVALVWRARATILDAAGALLVAVFVAAWVRRGGLLVVGVWLMVQAFNVERRHGALRAAAGRRRGDR